MRKKYREAETEIKRLSTMYKTSNYQPAKDCYVDLFEIILNDLTREERFQARNYWDGLIGLGE